MVSCIKKWFFIVVVVGLIGFFGCGKTAPDTPACTSKSPSADSDSLVKYAADSSIYVTKDTSGLFYQIIDAGNSTKPVFSSILTVNYIGRLMNGVVFDSASNSNLYGAALNRLIIGWQIGLPKIGVGGRIKLLIPSALAWGCAGYGLVPANAPVYFDVRLLQVN
jgi:FKBP-type peptidyl-prolyl cis-trans isomerase